jgi:hypothetical protein
MATLLNGAACTPDGVALDGVDDYVDLDDWEWGGATSFEAYVKYDSFSYWSPVFCFGSGADADNVYLANEKYSSTVAWDVYQGSGWNAVSLKTSSWDVSAWTHVVATVSGTNLKLYKNGALVGTHVNVLTHEPVVSTRTQHWLGRSNWDEFFDVRLPNPQQLVPQLTSVRSLARAGLRHHGQQLPPRQHRVPAGVARHRASASRCRASVRRARSRAAAVPGGSLHQRRLRGLLSCGHVRGLGLGSMRQMPSR